MYVCSLPLQESITTQVNETSLKNWIKSCLISQVAVYQHLPLESLKDVVLQ